MTNEPYDTGNDDWIAKQVIERVGSHWVHKFTETELLRILYMAASGKFSFTRDEIDLIGQEIRNKQKEKIAIAKQA